MLRTDLHAVARVDQPFARVRALLLANPHDVFRHATAATGNHDATLHASIGPIDLATDVQISVHAIANADAAMDLSLVCCAARDHHHVIPTIDATLHIEAISLIETTLSIDGAIRPPFGPLDRALDLAGRRRLLVAAMARFVEDVAGWLDGALESSRRYVA